MTWIGRPGRATQLMLLVAAVTAAGGAGCQEADKIEAKEQRIKLGASAASVCPDQDATLQRGTTNMIATVFAPDGTLAENVEVSFSSAYAGAVFDPATKASNAAGIAITSVSSTRPPGDQLTMTATIPTGLQSSYTLAFPLTPVMSILADNTSPVVGADVLMTVTVTRACNITELGADISYDATVLEYQPGQEVQLNVLNDVTPDGTPTGTTLDVDNSVPGHVIFRYFRDDGRGVNTSSGYLRFTFKAIAAGDAQLAVVSPSAELIGSVGGAYNLYPSGSSPFVGISNVTVVAGFR